MQQIKAGAHNEIAADEFMMTHLKVQAHCRQVIAATHHIYA